MSTYQGIMVPAICQNPACQKSFETPRAPSAAKRFCCQTCANQCRSNRTETREIAPFLRPVGKKYHYNTEIRDGDYARLDAGYRNFFIRRGLNVPEVGTFFSLDHSETEAAA